MGFNFGNLKFEIDGERIFIDSAYGMKNSSRQGFIEIQIAGENKDTHLGIKMANSSEGAKLRYVSHKTDSGILKTVQRSELVEVTTTFESYGDSNAIRVKSEIKNISESEIIIEEASSFVLWGLGKNGIDSAKEMYLTRFTQIILHTIREGRME